MDITDDFYPQLRRLAFAAARKIGGFNVQDGDDLTQAVAFKLWRFRDRIRSADCFSVIAYRTAARTWINMCRSRSTRRAHLSLYCEKLLAVGEPTCEYPGPLPAAEIWKRVAELDPRIAEAVHRHFYHGQSYVVIGRALGVSKSTVHNLVQNGLRQLRPRLADACGSESDDPSRGAGSRQRHFHPSPLAIGQEPAIQTDIAAKRAANAHTERGQ